jgi:hypothetical protein
MLSFHLACFNTLFCVKVFANVAYGWKGGMAISGRFRLGNIQTLMKRTGVQGEFFCFCWNDSKISFPSMFFFVRTKDNKYLSVCIWFPHRGGSRLGRMEISYS